VARYSSPASFDVPYGDSGLRSSSSRALALAVNRAAGRGENDPGAYRARRLEHADRAHDVDVRVEHGPLDGGADIRLRRQMEDDLRPKSGSELPEHLVADVELVQRDSVGDVLAASAREVVDHVHLITSREQRIRDVRADEARAAGNDHPHRLRIVSL
jgi:hypothetical protein